MAEAATAQRKSDEIEKGLSGLQSSGYSDGGTAARVFGTFLTWMNDKTADVFVIATSNDVQALPPELLRKGRFDDVFYVDLPTQQERADIFSIGLRENGRDPKAFNVSQLAVAADQLSGAEIKEAIMDGMFTAFGEGKEVTDTHIVNAISATMPLARTMKEKIDHVRAWAKDHARPATEVAATASRSRRIQAT